MKSWMTPCRVGPVVLGEGGLRVFVEVLALAERRASPASLDAPHSGVV
ncbi:MAG: hypothetical protein NWE91_03860 [Candidatus Bathyarchaeota archaeon]|nr:hypothetical protein [Candidatus Bathyarchaeota archaeon]